MCKARESEEAAARGRARKRAAAIWKAGAPADAHPYLTRKGVGAYGLRVGTWRRWHRTEAGEWQERETAGALLVALRDSTGELHSLQAIFAAPDPDTGADKDFLSGGRKHGCYHAIGEPGGAILICEGYATGASLHKCTGHTVAIAFDAGNLRPVAEALRKKFPDSRLIVCGDNDLWAEGNPGATKAREAAQAAGAWLSLPQFSDTDGNPTDFNDLAQREGTDAVRRAIEAAEDVGGSVPASPKSPAPAAGDKRTAAPAAAGEPPAFRPRFQLNDKGLWLNETNRNGDPMRPRWICPPFEVPAQVRDPDNGTWGPLIEFRDRDGYRHSLVIQIAIVKGDGADVLALLMDRGFIPRWGCDRYLLEYLREVDPGKRARITHRTGWHGQGSEAVFVLPAASFGASDEEWIFKNDAPAAGFKARGTLAEWQSQVAARCRGNSRLLFAVSLAFAAPLLPLAEIVESGVFHLFTNESSTGKTTAVRVGASTAGGPDFLRRWRATSNNLEAIAFLHNDCPLYIDEIGQLDPRESAEIAYLFGNETEKGRANRQGGARPQRRFRLLGLSSGELSLRMLLQEGGRTPRGGHDVRIMDLPADAGAGLGIFEALHGSANGAELSRVLGEATRQQYGTAFPAYLRKLIENRAQVAELLKDGLRRFERQYLTDTARGQARRVAARFGLVGIGGELPTDWGITGWAPREAIDAAGKCFQAWLEGRGGESNQEERTMLAQVREFFSRHGEARFADWGRPATKDDRAPRVMNKAGFRKHDEATDEAAWFVYPEVWRSEVCKGFAANSVLITNDPQP